jgi:hypothetical protein
MILILLFLPSITNGAEKSFFADLTLNSFFPSDSDYKTIYKSSIILPEISIGYFFSQKFYVFGGFGFYSVAGKTPAWDFDAKMTQNIFSLGGGYFKEFSETLGLNGELGLVYISYTEELTDLELKNKSNCIGFRFSTKVQYKLSTLISLAIKLGYTVAKDTTDNITSNFGGLNTGLIIRFSF